MVISTYGNQATVARPKLKSVCFRNGTTDICENPTMDASQAGEAPFVFLMMTKPPAGPYLPQTSRGLTVAISRAQEVLVVFSNLKKWGTPTVKNMFSYPYSKVATMSNAEENTPIEQKQEVVCKPITSREALTKMSTDAERTTSPSVPRNYPRMLRIKRVSLKFQKARRGRVEDELATDFVAERMGS
ncbi:hypothetical protein BDW71DRAFT_203503 [Aspergillus fruticulosus]